VLLVLDGAHVGAVPGLGLGYVASVTLKLSKPFSLGRLLARIELPERHMEAMTEMDVTGVLVNLQGAECRVPSRSERCDIDHRRGALARAVLRD